MRLIDADALLEAMRKEDVLKVYECIQLVNNAPTFQQSEPFGYFKAEPFGWTDCAETDEGAIALYEAPTVQRGGWISVEDRLPENDKQVMAWVKDKDNKFGGYRELVNYGHYEFYTFDEDHPNADEEGLVSRTGWYYGRESEGEFDYLIFELDGKVSHWQPVQAAPTDTE